MEKLTLQNTNHFIEKDPLKRVENSPLKNFIPEEKVEPSENSESLGVVA